MIPTSLTLLCLGLAWILTRQRGQALRVGAIAVLGPLGGLLGLGLAALLDQPLDTLGLSSLAGSSLGAALGGGLGVVIGPVWNLRRSWVLPLAVLALSVEAALLIALLGGGRVSGQGASGVLLLAGLALALSAFRVGTTPEMAAWTRWLRGAVGGLGLLGVGAFWGWQERVALTPLPPLEADLLGNASTLGAWAVAATAAALGVLLLWHRADPWLSRIGGVVLLGLGLAMPAPVLAMRWMTTRTCDQHIPEPISAAERLEKGLPDPIEIPQGWCRAPLEPSLSCPRAPTLYTLDGNGWIAQRTEEDPLDTLWGYAWRRRGGIKARELRDSSLETPHFGPWLVSGGNREPMDLDGTLSTVLARLEGLPRQGPAQPAIVRAQITQFGTVERVQVEMDEMAPGQDFLPGAVELAFKAVDFPVSSCPGTQELVVPLYMGREAPRQKSESLPAAQ